MKYRIAMLFIVLSLCVSHYYFAKQATILSNQRDLKYKTDSFLCIRQGGMKQYDKLETPFKGRILSIAAGNAFTVIYGDIKKMTIVKFGQAVGAYEAVGLFFAMILMILFFKNPLLCIVALAAGVSYRWTPAAEGFIFPWDAPMLSIWAGILVLSQSRYRKWLPVAAGLAMGFKETIILAALIPLFDVTISKRERFNRFLITGCTCVAVKVLIDIAVGNPVPLFTMWSHYPTPCRTGEYWLVHRNINTLMQLNLNHTIFSAGGLIVAAFLLPVSKMSRSIVLTYIPFMFAFCVITEARLWNEMIPVILFGLRRTE